MEHNKTLTQQAKEILVLANQGDGRVVLAPIFFNGEARFALAYAGATPTGEMFLRILGVLLEPGDITLDRNGNPTSFNPPLAKNDLN